METKDSKGDTIDNPLAVWYLHNKNMYVSKRNSDELVLWNENFEWVKDIDLKLKNNNELF